ncbi:MAG: amino acid permease [Phycisphaerae bacterium]|nr:amino acid permease [Phycisphaerae bacterium]
MIVGTQKRPRVLRWYHAGPLLFGDWGTSRLYVLGLAFYYTGHASPLYLAAMSLIMAAVAWAYTVVCRSFPEGGGVYTAARQIHPTLAVIGATLLLCDYIVTAALSAVEGFHYFGAPGNWVVGLCVVTIFLVGIVNWLGARSAGTFALLIAVVAIATSAVLGAMCLPLMAKGAGTVSGAHGQSLWEGWESLVRIVLALSGVEAVANMTGLMTQPVARTAKRTIWPVLAEVIVLNMIFGLAFNALPQVIGTHVPDYQTYEVAAGLAPENVPADVKEYRDTALKVLATHTGTGLLGAEAGRVFGVVCGAIFGLLLLSATNTAIMAMVSVMYSMSHDRELPRFLGKLNFSGVPWIGLLLACAVPALLLMFEADVKSLGELYAIGVVGAITINFLSCAANRGLALGRWERRGLWSLGGLMAVIEATIIVAKPNATIFAGSIIALVLAARAGVRAYDRRRASGPAEPEIGWMGLLQVPAALDRPGARIMLAARGRHQGEFAVDLARRRKAVLFAIYVRTLRLIDVAPGAVPRIEDDREALESLGAVALLAHQYGVPFVPIYVASPDVAEEILDYTVTFGCDTLIMGKSARRLFSRKLEGDFVVRVAEALPEGVALITRESVPHPMGTPPHPAQALPSGAAPGTDGTPAAEVRPGHAPMRDGPGAGSIYSVRIPDPEPNGARTQEPGPGA